MVDATPQSSLEELLSALPGYSVLTDGMKQTALAQSRVPDSAGVWPGRTGYVDTYDVYWAALQLLGFLQAQPFVPQSSSEGTSVSVDAPNWAALVVYYRSMSRVAQSSAGGVLGSVGIPGGPHVRRTDMSGRWDSHGDVDTDLG